MVQRNYKAILMLLSCVIITHLIILHHIAFRKTSFNINRGNLLIRELRARDSIKRFEQLIWKLDRDIQLHSATGQTGLQKISGYKRSIKTSYENIKRLLPYPQNSIIAEYLDSSWSGTRQYHFTPALIRALNQAEQKREIEVIQKLSEYHTQARTYNWAAILFLVLGIGSVMIWTGIFMQRMNFQLKFINRLNKNSKKLKELSMAREMIIANISHEIRTPMNTIIGFSNLLLKYELGEKPNEFVKLIQQSGDNVLCIINDLLDSSKIEAGKMPIESKVFSLREVLLSLENMFSEKCESKNIDFRIQAGPDVPERMVGDAIRLKQILTNLVGNAVKFTESGFIRVAVQVTSQKANGFSLRFTVEDTGIGIPAETLPKIFERFTQAGEDITYKYGGTGLGLSIVKQLVDLQNGNIEVLSERGKGSTFTIVLPYRYANQESPKAIEIQQDIHPSTSKPVSILLVEDNTMNQLLMRYLMDRWGYLLQIAGNGREAIIELNKGKYDLIIMDLQMPVLNGYDTVQYIRNIMKSTIPVIAMTAHAMNAERTKCLTHGMNEYISKPIMEEELLTIITKCLAIKNIPENKELIPVQTV